MYIFQAFHIPDHMLEGIKLYADHGILPGGFLQAVISHDLFEAVGRADSTNIHDLPAFCSYFYYETPSGCHGSQELMEAWMNRGGTKGEENGT